MARDKDTYRAYMVRLWQTERDCELVWWASLESPHTGERHHFTDLEDMFEFLQVQVDDLSAQTPTWQELNEHE